MFCDYIKIAVSHILSEQNGGIERCCGSCNPSCDDLTRFICFGHTIAEVTEWIKNNRDKLNEDMQTQEAKLDLDYSEYLKAKELEAKLNYSKSFCTDCIKFIEMKAEALEKNHSIFDAVSDLERLQKNCIKNCKDFNTSFDSSDVDIVLDFE